jgi:excisionase family DNA binding protein
MTRGSEKMNRVTEQSVDPATIQDCGSPATNSPLLIDFAAAAALLGIGVSTFYAMNRSGELGPRGIRLRRRRLWRRDELATWVRCGCPRRELWIVMSRNLREGT